MVTRTERKTLEKEGWRSTGDIPFRIAYELHVNGATLSMHVTRILRELVTENGKAYEAEHVKRFGDRYAFVDAVCYEDIKAKVERLRRK